MGTLQPKGYKGTLLQLLQETHERGCSWAVPAGKGRGLCSAPALAFSALLAGGMQGWAAVTAFSVAAQKWCLGGQQ